MSRQFIACFCLSLALTPIATSALAQPAVRFRKLAPGVTITVAPNTQEGETYTGPLKLRYLPTVDFTPNYAPKTETLFERAKHVTLRREVWGFEFMFKPLRMIEADIPQPDGRMKKKNIWYIVYRLRNIGGAYAPKPETDVFGKFTPEKVDTLDPKVVTMPNRFYPIFVMEGWVQDPITKEYAKVPYTDRVIPSALGQIRDKEEPGVPLASELPLEEGGKKHYEDLVTPCFRDSVQFHRIMLPLSNEENENTFWGIATWEDIDPRVDYVSIFIQGLTNAFRFHELPDGKRKYLYKTLQLNFWRPGDALNESDDRIRFGVPLVSNPLDQIRLFEMYNIPGPSIAVYEHFPQTRRENFVFRIDSPLDDSLESTLRKELNAGTFSEAVSDGFAGAGPPLASPPTLEIVIDLKEWRFQVDIEGVNREFRVRYDPQYWEKIEDGIDVQERVDHLWIYR